MKTIKKTILIDATPKTLHRYLSDAKRIPEWLTNMEDVRAIKGSGVGQKYQWTYRMAGLKLKGESEVTEDQPGKRRVTKTKGGVNSTWTYDLEPKNGSTHLTLKIDYEIPMPVLGRLAENLLVKRNERDATTSLEHLKDMAETEEERQRAAQ